jgi:hypothetical protein
MFGWGEKVRNWGRNGVFGWNEVGLNGFVWVVIDEWWLTGVRAEKWVRSANLIWGNGVERFGTLGNGAQWRLRGFGHVFL